MLHQGDKKALHYSPMLTFNVKLGGGFLVQQFAGVFPIILGAAVLDLQAALQPVLEKLVLAARLQLLQEQELELPD